MSERSNDPWRRGEDRLEKDTGYRGVWYYNEETVDEYVYKYSGGLGTYPQPILPLAYHAPEVQKTFFCYGGSAKDENRLLHMVSYFDHATGRVPKPTILMDKKTDDAHDNPSMMLDADGHVWVFSNAHGTGRPAYIYRSRQPYAIDDFELTFEGNFSYAKPWWIAGKGFLVPHTHYQRPEHGLSRWLYWMTSPDGRTWSKIQPLAACERGHYQISWMRDGVVGTAFNFHPVEIGVNGRTNLYYLDTPDFGETWQTASGEVIDTPMTDEHGPALVHDYEQEGLLVYLKTFQFDNAGRPVILFITSRGWQCGPTNAPRMWRTAHWTGKRWAIRDITSADNNYDFGPLHIEADGTWRLIAPTEPGPQPGNPGGEVVMWTSTDEGRRWTRQAQLTHDSLYNHTYLRRPVNAHPDFYAFWADGDARKPSPSRLYFCNRKGDVFHLPEEMEGEFAKPALLK